MARRWPLSLFFPGTRPLPAPTPFSSAEPLTVELVLEKLSSLNERQWQQAIDLSTKSGVVLGLLASVSVALFTLGSQGVGSHPSEATAVGVVLVVASVLLSLSMRAHSIEFGLDPLKVAASLDVKPDLERYSILVKGLEIWDDNLALIQDCLSTWYAGIFLALVGVALFVLGVIY